jgi:hypothetical protein
MARLALEQVCAEQIRHHCIPLGEAMNRDKEQAFVFIGGFALIVGLILAKLAGWV